MDRQLEQILWAASASNTPVHVGHIRSYCRTDSEVVSAWKMAERLGVELHGKLNNSEWKALVNPNPRA